MNALSLGFEDLKERFDRALNLQLLDHATTAGE